MIILYPRPNDWWYNQMACLRMAWRAVFEVEALVYNLLIEKPDTLYHKQSIAGQF